MMVISRRSASFKLMAVLACGLALSACNKKPKDLDATGPGQGLGAAAPGSKQQFETEIGDRIFFTVDQSNLTPEGQEILTRQAQWLQQYPNVSVQVEGHADERGTREYNISLSARRATAAREFLIQQGVIGSRISSIAYGKERPAALCDEAQCWNQNRRAVTVITGGTN
jgi:peptidoglycan-associated lipoprotein